LVEYGEKKLRWPTTVAVTPGNIKDYHAFTMTLVSRMPSATKAILGDSGYNTEDVFKVVENKQAILMVPIKIKKNTAGWRKDRAEKIQSDDGKRPGPLGAVVGPRSGFARYDQSHQSHFTSSLRCCLV
jgi:transposase